MAMQKVGTVIFLALMGVALASGARTLHRSVAISTSSSSSSSNAGSNVKEVLAEAFAKAEAEGGDANSIAHAAARDVGVAFAEAWARASGTVFVSGNGQATSFARASAHAQAEIFGRAIAGAVAEATNGKNFAGSAVRAEDVAAAIVQATVNVDVKLTTTGGFAKATSEATARVVADVVAEAIGDAIAFTVNNRAESGAGAIADVQVETREDDANANTTVDVNGDSRADANANAETLAQRWPVCSGDAGFCCNVHNGNSCNNGRFNRNDVGSVKGWKENGSNQSCKC